MGRHLLESFNDFDTVAIAEITEATKVECEHCANHDLRSECFGRCNADLWTRMLIDAAVALASNGGADAVVDRQGAVAFTSGFAECAECIDRFARLADGDDEGVFIQRRVAVAKLGGVFDFDRDASIAFD